MKRREPDDPDVVTPPVWVVDYRVWCASRGEPPYGKPDDRASMKAAVARFDVWEEARQAWADAHGVDEIDLDVVAAAPWDEDAI
ncbi:hypothetical protein A9W99_02775 [Mycobacterium sp. 1164966.3]|uniref:hypothetical protein n=1 Tax=Mycobacterium sp. 1164966.3 TaxID=1856861 RepID=UPI0007FE0DDB|nr:hypothetical protein [Mycobacterium sp. 1164966.3]OBA81553.1 hypothetical protein A9W99_02775 [Mycobacterium sp. 1164966.3]